jgi:DNA repair photolyase
MNKNYVPKRVFVSKSALVIPRTGEILARLKLLNPDIEIYNINTNTPQRPNLNGRELHHYIKETLVLCTRSAPYMEVFASPGNISENLGVVGKIASHCPLGCIYCYLNISGRGTPWNRVYVDIENFYEQAVKERLAYRMTLTLWSAISFHLKTSFNKVPDNFKNICDHEIRKVILKKRASITNDKTAIRFMKQNLGKLFEAMGISITEKQEYDIKAAIPVYYEKNKEYPLWINVSEYSDVIGLDHLTNIMEELMQLVNKDPEFRIKLRTKAANINNLLKYDSSNQVQVAFGLNTDFVINKYEKGTALLDDRIYAINALIQKGGYIIQIAVEPIVKYKGYEKDYQNLINRIIAEVDLSKISKIKIGAVRYKTQLKNYIKTCYPKSGLLARTQQLVEPEEGDNRWRYGEEERIKIYSIIKDELQNVSNIKLELASENPELWNKLGMNKNNIHEDVVYQFH